MNQNAIFSSRLFLRMTCLGLMLVLSTARAQEANVKEQPPRSKTIRVLVLFDNSIQMGEILKVPRGYLVTNQKGRIVIAARHVKIEAESLYQAYLEQQRGMKKPTIAMHLKLAQWCLQHEITKGAKNELYEVLSQQPQHQLARQLVVQMNTKKTSQPTPSHGRLQSQSQSPEYQNNLAIAMTTSQAPPLPGLDYKTGKVFTTFVHPYIVNRCANGGCHGVPKKRPQAFHLSRFRKGGTNSRKQVESNLNAIYRQIDFENFDQSPFVKKPLESHGVHSKIAKLIRRDRKQWLKISAWMQSIEKNNAKIASRKTTLNGSIVLASGNTEAMSQTQIQNAMQTQKAPMKEPPTTSQERFGDASEEDPQERLFNKILQEEKTDAFDPAIFNRKHHGS